MANRNFVSYRPTEIRDYVYAHPEYERAAILLSGGCGLLQRSQEALRSLLKGRRSRSIPAFPPLVYFLGKLHLAWEDVCLMSVHGRKQNLIGAVKRNRKVFALVGEKRWHREDLRQASLLWNG